MSPEEARAALEERDFERFIGAREGDAIEFKGSPYRLDEEWQAFELAKDISALANARGGMLVIGPETRALENSTEDEVVRVRPFDRGLVSLQQYRDRINARVYPRVEGLRVEFYPTADDGDRGLLCIDIPQQSDDRKFFLIRDPIAEGEQRAIRGWLLAIAVRAIDQVDLLPINDLHVLIRDGRRNAQQAVESQAEPAPVAGAPAVRLRERVDRGLEEL